MYNSCERFIIMVQLRGKLKVLVIEARGLPNLDFNLLKTKEKSDPFCIVEIEGANGQKKIGQTHTVDDDLNPKWLFVIDRNIDQDVSGLKFTVKDEDILISDFIGSCFLDAASFLNGGKKYTGFINLTSIKCKSVGSLRVTVQFTSAEIKLENIYSGTKEKMTEKALSHGENQVSVPDYKSVFLHGALNICIEKATNLPDLDTSIVSIKKSDVSDSYVDISIQDGSNELWKVGVTSVIDNNLNPVWNETFDIMVCHAVKSVKLVIRDKDVVSSNIIGVVTLWGEELLHQKIIKGDFSIFTSKGKRGKGKISLSMKYISAEEEILSMEVPRCIFPMRKCNEITLYHDAHGISKDNKEKGNAWVDIHNTLMAANEYIYIIGWSLNPNVSLLRFTNKNIITIGELLLQKANQGVQVCILLWNEATSTDLNKDGVMSTSDEVTANYFKDTKVNCSLAIRKRKNKHLISTKTKFTLFCFSHHQKIIIADKTTNGINHPVAFLGGLDLTKGRFDTPEHSLFSDLDTCYQNDFYNHIFDTNSKVGPRQPWHDIHCKITGLVVLDIFRNFQQRWKKQGSNVELKVMEMQQPNDKPIVSFPEFNWNVQLFRSINSDSINFSRRKLIPGVFIKKGRLFEDSIHRAYIHNIRRSKKFIYIENQYFMGSSHFWVKDQSSGICNLIPIEIVTHIEEKIKKKERFIAYIVIPMFPEGNPSNGEIKEMMFWQYRTIEMMYKRIAQALQKMKLDHHPQEYLLFFALAKREGGCITKIPQSLQGFAANAFRNQRLMIYVHSKLAIFDDEYVIIGSANINDRSLTGNRDSEIAVGAFQSDHVCDSSLPSGDVSKFRKSLWIEHMGEKAPIKSDPSNPYCINKVKMLAEEGLGSFLSVNSFKCIRHLIIYPLKVHTDGSVTVRPDCPTIPDTNISFIGCRSRWIPTKLTS